VNYGIFCFFCTVSDKPARLNLGDGINATAGSNVFGKTVFVDRAVPLDGIAPSQRLLKGRAGVANESRRERS
jgi:hypothetical protein